MNKKIISVSFALSMILAGCGTESSKVDNFESSQNLDNANYQKIIDELGNCESIIDDERVACLTNLGAAYFGLAGFDIISLAQELTGIDESLSDDEQDKEFNKIIFNKLLDKNTEEGLRAYTKILTNEDDSICSQSQYDNLSTVEKNACLSISPILLKDSLDDEEDSSNSKSETSATLNDIINFKNVITNAAPEIDGNDLSSIVNNNEELSPDKDINGNGELDSVEATRCALSAYNTLPTNFNVCPNVTISDKDAFNTNDVFGTTGTYQNIDSVIISISNLTNTQTKNFYRLIKQIDATANTYTSISLDTSVIVDSDLSTSTNNLDGINTFYKPVVNKDANGEESIATLNTSITSTLNNSSVFESIALLTNAEDDNKTESEKVETLQKEICSTNTTIDLNTNGTYGMCAIENNQLEITQDAIFAYIKNN